MNALIDFLKTIGYQNPSVIEEEFLKLSVKVFFDGPFALFKYNDLGANFTNPVVRECRGIIVNLESLEVVCYPFSKFGNYSEPYADSIDWKSAKVQEKLDGSLIKLWYNKNFMCWVWSTNGTIYAYKAPHPLKGDFGKLIESASNFTKIQGLYSSLDKNFTYMFELVSPNNRIVINYPETKLIHIGTRENATGKEFEVDLGIEKPKVYSANSLDEAVRLVNTICTPKERHEGFVVVDKDYHRVKVKSEFYLKAHYLTGKLNNPEKVCEFLDCSDALEIEAYIPEYKELFDIFREEFSDFRKDLDDYLSYCFSLIKKDSDFSRKEYALKIKDSPFSSYGFRMLDLYLKKEANPVNKILSDLSHKDLYKIRKDDLKKCLKNYYEKKGKETDNEDYNEDYKELM